MTTTRVLAVIGVAALAGSAHAWEAETTQAGLAEQAALASRLDHRLITLGWNGGLFEPLTIPPADAPALIADLHLLSPSQGMVPDARGRQTALAWLAAGAALADLPARLAANHFYDVWTGKGWTKPERSLLGALDNKVREQMGRAALPDHGVPAPDWVVSNDNPFNLANFMDQYAKAASAATPGERSRHMAAALIAAGAMMHVLGDLGAPSRVRGDEAAHLAPLGAGPDDRGSRFVRIAALSFGRLGVPAPSRVITRARLRDYFTSRDGTGLADEIASTYFSPGTLPRPSRVADEAHPVLARPKPTLPARLNLVAATREEGTTLRASDGTCLARYRVEHDILTFSLDDDCMLEQVTQILPEVAAYETGLLDFLLRGELTITIGPMVAVSAKDLGVGTTEVLVEDERGVRTSLGTVQSILARKSKDPVELARVPTPQSGTKIIAVFRGVDASGEPIVAVGALPMSR